MNSASHPHPKTLIDKIEVTAIAAFLGLMTVVTFANVVARYVFNSNILWALETTVFLFAWLVLLGASHGVRVHCHIGVDLILNMVGPGLRKVLVLISVALCVVFSILFLIGAWDYWYPFVTKQSWYEVNDIPMFLFPDLFSQWFNEGEAYEKMPRFIPYACLPLGMLLLAFRFIQAGWEIFKGEREMLIASHEAEEMVSEVSDGDLPTEA